MKRSTWIPLLLCLLLSTACNPSFTSDNPGQVSEENGVEFNYSDLQTAATETITEESPSADSSDAENAFPFGEKAFLHLAAISDGIGYRVPGSAEEAQTARYIENAFSEMGYQPVFEYFSAEDYEEETISSANVIAIKEGESDRVIVVGAHYDAAYEEGTRGADDNASGVAVMLEAAELVSQVVTPFTIKFVAFGSEELALNGSTWFVDHLDKSELDRLVGMVNLDSLIAGDKMYVYGNDGRGSMRDWALADARRQGLDIEGKTEEELFNPDGSPCECADFDAFEKAGIPYTYFEATNWDLSPDAMIQVDPQYGVDGEIRHTRFDTLDYIEETFPGRIKDHLSSYSLLLYDILTQYQ